ncbi:putative regulatory protein N [Escherichia coli 3-073-06_S4_C3]|nr:putative regulatory protein N [Escherichia coli 3-073-06_S4_C3]
MPKLAVMSGAESWLSSVMLYATSSIRSSVQTVMNLFRKNRESV